MIMTSPTESAFKSPPRMCKVFSSPSLRHHRLTSPKKLFHTSSIFRNMPRSAETASFQFNHTMIRVKDANASIKFYTEILGMELISKSAFSDFTLYFLGFDHSNGADSIETKEANRTNREGVLELTHNHGTENDPNFQGYHNGNKDPRGFGHIAISVDDVEKACERFEKLGVKFQKKPSDGKMRHIAFILDPDGYWVEIVPTRLRTGQV